MAGLVWAFMVVLLVLWFFGFVLHFGGPFIHVLGIIAVFYFIYSMLNPRGARAVSYTHLPAIGRRR